MPITKHERAHPDIAIRWRRSSIQQWEERKRRLRVFGNREGVETARKKIAFLKGEKQKLTVILKRLRIRGQA